MLKKINEMGRQEYDLIVFPEAVTGFVRDVGVFNQGFRSEYWKAADSIPGNLTKKIEKMNPAENITTELNLITEDISNQTP